MFATAAPRAPTSINLDGCTTSEMLKMLETSAPRTNPNCTAIVIHAAAVSLRAHSIRSCRITADAENQGPMARTSAVARSASAIHRRGSVSSTACTGWLAEEHLCGLEELVVQRLQCSHRVPERYALDLRAPECDHLSVVLVVDGID